MISTAACLIMAQNQSKGQAVKLSKETGSAKAAVEWGISVNILDGL